MRFMFAVAIFFTLFGRLLKDAALPFIGITVLATLAGAGIAAIAGGSAIAGALWAGGLTIGGLLAFTGIRVLSIFR